MRTFPIKVLHVGFLTFRHSTSQEKMSAVVDTVESRCRLKKQIGELRRRRERGKKRGVQICGLLAFNVRLVALPQHLVFSQARLDPVIDVDDHL